MYIGFTLPKTKPLENEKIRALEAQLQLLQLKQNKFQQEVQQLQLALEQLKKESLDDTETESIREEVIKPESVLEETKATQSNTTFVDAVLEEPDPTSIPQEETKSKLSLEKFIGENLINKIGILIVVIGVVIGAKYAIKHQLISPAMRIVMGYFIGFGLLAFAVKLKAKYHQFSAVLLSGAMAILYFLTFAAYDLYHLIPQVPTFLIMLVFTAFTVFAAIKYEQQIIAHLGLVGAYGIPFLLSSGSGKVEVLLTYMLIINIGVLFIAFKRYWKPLYYVAFGATWLIFASWILLDFNGGKQVIAYTFLFLFFALFYTLFLAYKVIRKESFSVTDVITLAWNSGIFYGLGYYLLDREPQTESLLGLFTLFNAVLHFGVMLMIKNKIAQAKKVIHLVGGLVLVFVTLAIPVQLDGHWVTLFWSAEALLFLYLGRSKRIAAYEVVAAPLFIISFLSLAHDWGTYTKFISRNLDTLEWTPILNGTFLTGVLFFLAVLAQQWVKKKYPTAIQRETDWDHFLGIFTPIVLLSVSYVVFWLDLHYFFERLQFQANQPYLALSRTPQTSSIGHFQTLWEIHFTMIYLCIWAFVQHKKWRSDILQKILLGIGSFTLLTFMVAGLYSISELREEYLENGARGSSVNLTMRYISLCITAMFMWVYHNYVVDYSLKYAKRIFTMVFHTCLLWYISSELLHWMHVFGYPENYKLALSILWGLYAVFLAAFGIWKSQKVMRIAGMGLLGITLLKLFFYDIAHLETISKTIVFISLGVCMLVVSFLYNKFKYKILDSDE